MKILDILCEADTRVLKKVGSIPVILADTLPVGDETNSSDFLGAGVQTRALRHRKSGSIVKYTDLTGLNDPTLAWINQCMFLKNPYLPVYMNAKIYTDKRRFVLVSTSKPLSGSLEDVTEDDAKLKILANIKLSKVGEVERVRWIKEKSSSADDYYGDVSDDMREIRYRALFMLNMLNQADSGRMRKAMQMIGDDDLLEAIRLLQQFDDSDMDLHTGNFMWDGDQLVINDPVYNPNKEGSNKLTPKELRTPVKRSAANAKKDVEDEKQRADLDHRQYSDALKRIITGYIDDNKDDSEIIALIKDRVEGNAKLFAPVTDRLNGQSLEQWISDVIASIR